MNRKEFLATIGALFAGSTFVGETVADEPEQKSTLEEMGAETVEKTKANRVRGGVSSIEYWDGDEWNDLPGHVNGRSTPDLKEISDGKWRPIPPYPQNEFKVEDGELSVRFATGSIQTFDLESPHVTVDWVHKDAAPGEIGGYPYPIEASVRRPDQLPTYAEWIGDDL